MAVGIDIKQRHAQVAILHGIGAAENCRVVGASQFRKEVVGGLRRLDDLAALVAQHAAEYPIPHYPGKRFASAAGGLEPRRGVVERNEQLERTAKLRERLVLLAV